MKKAIITLMIATSLAFTLVSCGTSSTDNGTTTENSKLDLSMVTGDKAKKTIEGLSDAGLDVTEIAAQDPSALDAKEAYKVFIGDETIVVAVFDEATVTAADKAQMEATAASKELDFGSGVKQAADYKDGVLLIISSHPDKDKILDAFKNIDLK